MAYRYKVEKADSRLVRMNEELVKQLVDDGKVVWGEPVEYVLVDIFGKNYMEPVFVPTIYNDNNETQVEDLTSTV